MQYVRNISDSVSTAWNSINPATLSGAIDVIVVEQEDGTLACSPFHVRFGKFSLLRPSQKKVEFRVNGDKQEYAMKLGEGGEAFFVFETSDTIPQSMQTSPLVSPASSPPFHAEQLGNGGLQDVEPFELNGEGGKSRSSSFNKPLPAPIFSSSAPRDSLLLPRPTSPLLSKGRPATPEWLEHRPHSEDILRQSARAQLNDDDSAGATVDNGSPRISDRSASPPRPAPAEAIRRAMALSKELSAVNIATHVTETGDLMLDMTGYKSNEEDAIRAEILARKVLSEELDGNYDIGALFGVDEHGNLWIYSSEEAKEAAMNRTMENALRENPGIAIDAASDPGYHSDGTDVTASPVIPTHRRSESDVGQMSLQTPPTTPGSSTAGGDPNRNYAKTLRLTSDQLKALDLKPGENSMSFTVNRATCSAYMFLWKADTPVVISDIDGTITKSDALGQVLNMIGRDWTHAGVAKLYSDIAQNGYNIMYLTSRSVGQSDSTRAYLAGIVQDGYRLPRGPTILSPDRTMAALRREIYLRKPHIFKMSTLRDIRSLYGPDRSPFYAGFGNRLTDQISYRTVDVPKKRIFTINSNAEVSLDLLSLNKLRLSYVNITEVVDHYFPPVSTLSKGGGEEYTDFNYWRDTPLELDEFSASDTDDDDEEDAAAALGDHESQYAEDDDEEVGEEMGDSYISRDSVDDYGEGSVDGEQQMMSSLIEDEDADDEEDGRDDDDDDDEVNGEAVPPATPRIGDADHGAEALKPPTTAGHKLGSPRIAVQDLNAEMITGVKNLSIEKETK